MNIFLLKCYTSKNSCKFTNSPWLSVPFWTWCGLMCTELVSGVYQRGDQQQEKRAREQWLTEGHEKRSAWEEEGTKAQRAPPGDNPLSSRDSELQPSSSSASTPDRKPSPRNPNPRAQPCHQHPNHTPCPSGQWESSPSQRHTAPYKETRQS